LCKKKFIKKAYKTFDNVGNIYEPEFFENLFKRVDLDQNGKINYHGKKITFKEFL